MAWVISTALAATFTWTSAGAGLDASVTIGGTAYGVTLPTGSYRVCLAPTTGATTDILRALQSALNTAVAASGRTFTVTIAATGLVSIAIDTGTYTCLWDATTIGRLLGLQDCDPGASATGTRPPHYLALAASVSGGAWVGDMPTALARTTDGRVFGVVSGVITRARTVRVAFVPLDPAVGTTEGTTATPARATDGAIGAASLGAAAIAAVTARVMSWEDFFYDARCATVAVALGDWPTVRASTSARYWLVSLDPGAVGRLPVQRSDDTWEWWGEFDLTMHAHSTTPQGTRA